MVSLLSLSPGSDEEFDFDIDDQELFSFNLAEVQESQNNYAEYEIIHSNEESNPKKRDHEGDYNSQSSDAAAAHTIIYG